jgi:hypothetical protein
VIFNCTDRISAGSYVFILDTILCASTEIINFSVKPPSTILFGSEWMVTEALAEN